MMEAHVAPGAAAAVETRSESHEKRREDDDLEGSYPFALLWRYFSCGACSS